MLVLLLSFGVSLVVTLLIVRSANAHAGLSADHDLSGPQKFHARPVPRIGGIAVMAGIFAGAILIQLRRPEIAALSWLLLASTLPTFVAGLSEDLTKRVSPRRRMFFTAVSAALAVWLLDAAIKRSDVPGLDQILLYTPVAVLLTVVLVTGVANAFNIIDGFNGLASMCALIMFVAIAYVAFQVRDDFVFNLALISAGAVIGFFLWNFPSGLIFLGDGGAYLLGFMVAELGILLVNRNQSVSPLFPVLMCAYPLCETLFTMLRRKIRGAAAGAPDGIHLHSLIHRRVIRWSAGHSDESRQTSRNSMTSPYLWILCLACVVPSVLWWESTIAMAGFTALFVVSYTALYRSIVRFKTPTWLVVVRR